MNEEQLNKLLEQETEMQPSGVPDETFRKKLRYTMNKTLYTRIFAALLVVALLGTGLYFGTSAILNKTCYAPSHEKTFLVRDTRGTWEFSLLMEDTVSMLFPGLRCQVVEQRAKGFGTYEVDVAMDRPFDQLYIGGPATDQFTLTRSKLTTGTAPFAMMIEEFVEPDSDFDPTAYQSPERIWAELEKLPESAVADVSISLGQYLNADEMAQLMQTYSGVSFQWLAMKGHSAPICPQIAGGMTLIGFKQEQFLDEERYAGYYLPHPSKLTGDDLRQYQIARLQLLADHPDFVTMMQSRFPELISRSIVQDRLELAQKEWACYGFRLTADKENIKALLDTLPVTKIQVNDVKVSRFEK